MIRRLKKQVMYLTFNSLDADSCILAYGDASKANLPEGRTQGGSMIFATRTPREGEVEIRGNLLAWASGRIRRVVLNSFGGELLQQMSTFDYASWMSKLWKEFRPERPSIPVHLRCDAMSVVEAVTFSLRQQVREKRLTPDLWALREAIATFEIASMEHVPTAFMIADGMTKYNNRSAQLITDAMPGVVRLPSNTEQSKSSFQKASIDDSRARGGNWIDVKTAMKAPGGGASKNILQHVLSECPGGFVFGGSLLLEDKAKRDILIST
jgi:hypothetical protein